MTVYIEKDEEAYEYRLCSNDHGVRIVWVTVNAGQAISTEQPKAEGGTTGETEPEAPAEGTFPQTTTEAITGEQSDAPAAPQV